MIKYYFGFCDDGTSTSIVCSSYTLCINNKDMVLSFGIAEYGEHGHEESQVFPPKPLLLFNL